MLEEALRSLRAERQRLQAAGPEALVATGGVLLASLPAELDLLAPLRTIVDLLQQALREPRPDERQKILTMFQEVLALGEDVNAAGPLQQSPLWSAAFGGD